ncbi:MAG: transposase, partial [Colwellia sp.]|nr:transposase [Colwellia sp.]
MKKQDEKWGLFWCKLLDPIIFGEIGKADINKYLKKLSQEEVFYPNGKRKRPSLSTLRRKYNKYTQGGFKNLARKTRSDQGSIRVVPDEVLATAIELKKEQPFRSDYLINQFIEARYGKIIPKSTLYRHLKQAGATRLKLGITKKKVRKRWTRDNTHDLWVGDFQDGPYVIDDNGVVRKAYLSLFIDAHSRFVVEGRYYLRETLDILIDSLLRAWVIHGSSKELYLDNAKIYHANALKAACYSLGIKLLHRPAGDPPPGGVVERFFGTNQGQFEAEVRAGDILTLDKLNRAFSAYLRVSYHTAIHSETKQAPQQRYESGITILRRVDMNAAIEF